MASDTEFIDSNLQESITEAVHEFAQQKELEGIKSLSRHNPKKAGKILYLFSQGVSQSTMSRHYGLHHDTIKHTLMEYANHTSRWRQLGAEINRRLFLELSSIEEDMVTDLQQRLSSGELKPTFSDLLPVTIALEKAERQATWIARDGCLVVGNCVCPILNNTPIQKDLVGWKTIINIVIQTGYLAVLLTPSRFYPIS